MLLEFVGMSNCLQITVGREVNVDDPGDTIFY